MSSSSLFKWVQRIRKFCLLGIKTQGWGRRRESIRIPNYNNFEFLENSKLFPTPEPLYTLFPLPRTLFFSIIGSSVQTDPLWSSYKSRLPSPLLSSITKSSLFFIYLHVFPLPFYQEGKHHQGWDCLSHNFLYPQCHSTMSGTGPILNIFWTKINLYSFFKIWPPYSPKIAPPPKIALFL